ncbi:phage baseplate assembly protein V [Variovorax gossypii]
MTDWGTLGRLRRMVMRVVLDQVDDGPKMQSHQVEAYGGITRGKVEHFQHYGFSSHPFPGAEGIGLSVGGSTNHMVILNVDDRRYRMKGMEGGEVAIYDDQGQSVHLTREGIVVKGAGLPMVFEDTPSITFKADQFVRFETPRVEATQLLQSMQLTIGGVTGGVGAAVATMNGGTMNFTNVTSNYQSSTTKYLGSSITSDGKPIDHTHKHRENGAGSLSDTPQ